jgi:hypothetical protein
MTPSTLLRGTAAVMSLAACGRWAALFLEHLAWFITGTPPPLSVWLAQVAHLLVVVGLLAAMWRRPIGVALVLRQLRPAR